MNLAINNFKHSEELFHQGLSLSEIEVQLKQLNLSIDEFEAHMKHVKNLRYAKHRNLGFTLLALGALLCLSGCLLTFLHNYSSMYAAFSLYGLTILGTCFILTGIALILGI